MSEVAGIGPQLQSFRETRRNLEASVLPLATSVDGRRFSFQTSLHDLRLQAGGFVVVEDGTDPRLGQVLALELDQQLPAELTLPALLRFARRISEEGGADVPATWAAAR